MKIIKKILAVIVLIALIVYYVWLYKFVKMHMATNDPKKAQEQMISFLDKKYGKEFEVIDNYMDLWPYHYDSLRVYPKGGNKKTDYFDVYMEKKYGVYEEFSDSYFGVLTHDDYVEKINGIASEFFPEFKVVAGYTSETSPNKYTNASQLQQALDEKVYKRGLSMRVAPTLNSVDEFNEKVDLFVKKLAKNKIRGAINIQYFKENKLDVDMVTSSMYYKDRQFYINSDFDVDE